MNIENNTILIVPNKLKKEVLKKIKKLINFKIISLEEFIKNYYFDYDNKTIHCLMNKYNLKYEVVNIYLKNIYYIENKDYQNEKLNKLVEIKNELENNNLLIKNDKFKEYINNKKIVVYGYQYIEKKYRKLLEELGATYIKEDTTYNNQKLYEFKTKEEEIDFLISKIIELKEQNISLNKIKIIDNEYKNEIEEKLKLYDINYKEEISLYGTNIINLLLNNIKENIEETLDIIKENIDLENELNLKIYNKLINILNEYTFIENKNQIKDMLIHDFKNTKIIKNNYKEKIEFISLENNIIDSNNHVFLLGFNASIYPKIRKDEEYITDNIKDLLDLELTKDINKNIKKTIIDRIRKTNNLTITYKTFDMQEYYISSLNEELNLDIIKDYKIPYYINLDNKIKLAKKLDTLNKYNIIEEDLSLLYNNYKDIPYNTYDNKFKGIKREKEKLLLSYSSMDNYFKCGFKYYIENVLKLNIYEEKFANIIGNLFHYVLEKAFKSNFNLDDTYNEYLNSLNKEFTNKEKLFLKNLKEELKLIIDTINNQLDLISLDQTLYEEKIYVNKNINVTFMGIIDKLMYKEKDGKTYVAIIDYKTGNPNLNLNNMIYGLDMQLPIYLYLSKHTNKLKNVEIIGFYLQKILNKEITIDKKKTYLEQKQDNLKLQGYSIDKEEVLELFDKTYRDSNLIKSLKIGNNGFYAYSKVLNEDTINKIIDLVDKKIEEASNNIEKNKFDINPKSINNENVSCKFCKYKDICYKKEQDIEYLKEYKDLEFL